MSGRGVDDVLIEAFDLIELRLKADALEGKPGHKAALRKLKKATDLWRSKFKPCPTCGRMRML